MAYSTVLRTPSHKAGKNAHRGHFGHGGNLHTQCALPRRRCGARGQRDVDPVVVAQQRHGDRLAQALLDLLVQRVVIGDDRVVDVEHNVARLNTGGLRRAVLGDPGHLGHQDRDEAAAIYGSLQLGDIGDRNVGHLAVAADDQGALGIACSAGGLVNGNA